MLNSIEGSVLPSCQLREDKRSFPVRLPTCRFLVEKESCGAGFDWLGDRMRQSRRTRVWRASWNQDQSPRRMSFQVIYIRQPNLKWRISPGFSIDQSSKNASVENRAEGGIDAANESIGAGQTLCPRAKYFGFSCQSSVDSDFRFFFRASR